MTDRDDLSVGEQHRQNTPTPAEGRNRQKLCSRRPGTDNRPHINGRQSREAGGDVGTPGAAGPSEGLPCTDGGRDSVGAQHVGPIIFANETARRELVEEGEVITFRSEPRTTGRTWWRESRTGPKKGDVTVEEIRPIDPRNPHDLTPAQPFSGFDSVADWMDAIEEMHGELPELGVLYRVREVETDG